MRLIFDAEKVLDIVKREQPEAIIHLAARAGVRPSLEEPLLYQQVNVGGTLVLREPRDWAASANSREPGAVS